MTMTAPTLEQRPERRRATRSAGPLVSDRLEAFLASGVCTTPYLVVDLDVVAARYDALRAAAPDLEIFYAVKALDGPPVIELLRDRGANFDVASRGEIDRCLALDVTPERLSYGNTVKRREDIRHAHALGVDAFTFDSAGELAKLTDEAPGATLVCRLACDGQGAAWPLGGKFGVTPTAAVELLDAAAALGHPVGVCFHVGSQQQDPHAWRAPLQATARVFDQLRNRGIEPVVLDIGGGFPATYRGGCPPLEAFTDDIRAEVARTPALAGVRLVCEPGRFLVAEAGAIDSEVLLVTDRPDSTPSRWAFLDVGVYNGLGEVVGEAIRYHVRSSRAGRPEPTVLAGPTCDSTDVIYRRSPCSLPDDLAAGDHVHLLATGAYTSSYATAGFNGMPAIAVHYLPETR